MLAAGPVAFWSHQVGDRIVDEVAGNDAKTHGSVANERFAVDDGWAQADDRPEYSVDHTGALTICFALRVDDPFNSDYVYGIGKGDDRRYEWGVRLYNEGHPKAGQRSLYHWNLDGGLGSGAGWRDDGDMGLDYWSAVFTNDAVYGPANVHNNFEPWEFKGKCVLYRNGVVQPTGAPGNYMSQYGVIPEGAKAPVFIGRRGMSDRHWGGVTVQKLALFNRELSADEIRVLADSF